MGDLFDAWYDSERSRHGKCYGCNKWRTIVTVGIIPPFRPLDAPPVEAVFRERDLCLFCAEKMHKEMEKTNG